MEVTIRKNAAENTVAADGVAVDFSQYPAEGKREGRRRVVEAYRQHLKAIGRTDLVGGFKNKN
jgi:hypothetical protein